MTFIKAPYSVKMSGFFFAISIYSSARMEIMVSINFLADGNETSKVTNEKLC